MQAEMSLEEARELAELTSAIVSNLKFIEDHRPSERSLAATLESTSEIVANLQLINRS